MHQCTKNSLQLHWPQASRPQPPSQLLLFQFCYCYSLLLQKYVFFFNIFDAGF